MLQRTRAEQVQNVYTKFCNRYSSPSDVLKDTPEKVAEILEPLGLKWRALKILELSKSLSTAKAVPQSYEELIKLPGIGAYAACAFLSFHCGKREAIIDANAVRLWTRVFGIKVSGEMRRNKEFVALVRCVTPADKYKLFNYAILDHTRTICKPKPLCNVCPLNHLCNYYQT